MYRRTSATLKKGRETAGIAPPDLRAAEEVARDVEHRAGVLEAGTIDDPHRRDRPGTGLWRRALDGAGQQLSQRLDAVEQPGARRGADPHLRVVGGEPVALVAETLFGEVERDRVVSARRAPA